MTAWLVRTVERLDRVNWNVLLIANALLSLFVLLAHGGALLLVRFGKSNDFGPAFDLVFVTIPVACASLLLALVAWLLPPTREVVLKVHTFALGCLAAFAAWYAIDVIATGIPTDTDFGWDPALFAFIVGYPVYLARRTLLPATVLERPVFRYAHIFAVAVSLVLSALVVWRIYQAAP